MQMMQQNKGSRIGSSSSSSSTSSVVRAPFSEKELHAMRTPHAVLNTQKGWRLDREKSQEIDTMMQPYFGTAESEALKNEVVDELQEIVTQWSTALAIQHLNVSLQDAKSKHCARLLTFGSSILGVSSRKSDIDMVCASPNFIQRGAHFEDELAKILQDNKHVRSLINIRTAKVPIITFIYKDQDVDISFAQIQLDSLPATIADFVDDELLASMEERDVLSLSGRRCNQAIVRSVPNLPAFQVALRFVKLWAQSKGIYENSVGFLGGISWAILMAKIAQMFPNYEPNQLLEQFFYFYSNWDFTNIHVLLNDYSCPRTSKQRAINQHMNVMTACFPEYNSTERVKEITLNIIKQRLNEANDLIQKEVKLHYKHYKDLLLNYDFIGSYSKFIEYGLYFRETASHPSSSNNSNSTSTSSSSSSSKAQPTEKEFEEFMNSSKVKILTLIQRLSEQKLKGVQFCPWPQFFAKTQVSFRKIQVIYIGINDSTCLHQQQLAQQNRPIAATIDLEKECKEQITTFYQFIKNDPKYSAFLDKFEVGMDWISSKDIIRKTFKVNQPTYTVVTAQQQSLFQSQKTLAHEKPDLTPLEPNLVKKSGTATVGDNPSSVNSPEKSNTNKTKDTPIGINFTATPLSATAVPAAAPTAAATASNVGNSTQDQGVDLNDFY